MSSFIRRLAVLSVLVAPVLLSPVLDSSNEASPLVAPGPDPVTALRVEPAAFAAQLGPGPAGDRLWQALQDFYDSRQSQPVWLNGRKLNREGEALLRALAATEHEGLDPERYGITALVALRMSARESQWPSRLSELDLRLTYAFLRYASDVIEGRFNPRGASPYWALRPAEVDLPGLLRESLSVGRFAQALHDLVPTHPQYLGLRAALARYRQLAERGGWEPLPADLRLKPGARDAAVLVLRRRLQQSGDLSETVSPEPDLLDKAMAEAVKRFQERHGLKPDGVVGKTTVAAFNVPVEERIRQVEVNMERWRWLPRQMGRRHVLVNIPTFEALAFEDGREVLRMNVVTGKAGESPTPVFAGEMTTVVFSPYWNVPPGILQDETIPAVLNNPSYLIRQDMEVVRGSHVLSPYGVDWSDPTIQVRQRPGARNALGLVKFLFPNRFSVYMHDTPSKSLFRRPRRDFSHGCVRVQKPAELAAWLLPDWSEERIRAAMHAGNERHVALSEPVPVYVAYFTVWIGDDNQPRFRRDIYGHDAPQQKLMPGGPVLQMVQSARAPAATDSSL